MISYSQSLLNNGIKLILNEDPSSSHIAISIIIDAGSKYDFPNKSGMAHLLEHVLFTGTQNFPDYDDYLQLAGGDGNAYTNQDIACFYTMVPRQNFSAFIKMEADRFINPTLNYTGFKTQKKVVIEEYKETCLNEPYGNLWHHLGKLNYLNTPYEWPPIGKTIQSIKSIQFEDLRKFHQQYYIGKRMTISISGPLKLEFARQEINKLFGKIKPGRSSNKKIKLDPKFFKPIKTVKSPVPLEQLYLCFRSAGRLESNYLLDDLLLEMAFTDSSSISHNLLREKQIVTDIDIFPSGHLHNGIVVVDARPSDGNSIAQVSRNIFEELQWYYENELNQVNLENALNRIESYLAFNNMNPLQKAMNLSYFGWLNRLDWINKEFTLYKKIKIRQLKKRFTELFNEKNSFQLRYSFPKKKFHRV